MFVQSLQSLLNRSVKQCFHVIENLCGSLLVQILDQLFEIAFARLIIIKFLKCVVKQLQPSFESLQQQICTIDSTSIQELALPIRLLEHFMERVEGLVLSENVQYSCSLFSIHLL